MTLVVMILLCLAIGVSIYRYPLLAPIWLSISIPFDLPLEWGITIYTDQILLVVAAMVVLLKNVISGYHKHLFSSKWLLVLLPFALATLLSGINAHHFPDVIKQFLRWTEMVVMAWIVINTITTRRELKTVIMIIVFTATVVSIIGIIQTIAGPTASFNLGKDIFTVDNGTTMRAYSTFGHPNQFAGYLILMIPLAFIQFVETKDWRKRTLVGLLAVIMITALVFTFSRGGWVAMGLVGAALIYLNIPKKMLMITSLIVALALTIIILNQGPLEKTRSAVLDRMMSFSQPKKEDSVGFRKVCYETAFKMFEHHPIFGFGAGEYDENIKKYFNKHYYAWSAISKHIHNWYVQILIETGLLGMITFFVALGAVLVRLLLTFLGMVHNYERQILSGVIGGILAFLIHNLFDVLTIYGRGIDFGLLVGLGLTISSMARQTSKLRVKDK